MEKAIIEVQDHGPYQLTGKFQLIDGDGNKYETESDISLCRCGKSGNKPFCDNTHEKIDFSSAPRAERPLIEV